MNSRLVCIVLSAISLPTGCYAEPAPASAPPLITKCGLELEEGGDGALARLQRQETITLNALASIHTDVDWTPELTCPLLRGAFVRVAPLDDGEIWRDDRFFELKNTFDRGSYGIPREVVVTTDDWANPEFSWQLVRIVTRGTGNVDDLLFLTAPAIADAAIAGRSEDATSVVPLTEEP